MHRSMTLKQRITLGLAAFLLALAAQAGAEQTHRAYLYGYPDGTIRPEAEVSRAAFACILLRDSRMDLQGVETATWRGSFL